MEPEHELVAAHRHCIYNRQELARSGACGCFYCGAIFGPHDITEWTDKDEQGLRRTALCPECGIDSVIGDASGFRITPSFLAAMHARWFEC